MRDRQTLVLCAFVGGLTFMCAGFSASDGPQTVPQTPKPGQAQSIAAPEFDYSSLESDGIDGIVAGRALAKLSRADEPTFRGASEAGIYRRASPAVVMVITKEGLGSGSVISVDGLILTCFHVVAGYSRVGIIFKPASEGQAPAADSMIVADVVKTDQVADLALLKLESPLKLPVVPIVLGDFSKVTVGDDVNAIGHPTGETWTYTKGYVSQIRKGYQWQAEDGVQHTADVIQTQTPINPGNSGGPLLNSAGSLIGVNAFKDAGEGLNFAIGSDEIQNFIHRHGNRVAQLAAAASPDCKPHVLFEGRNAANDASIKQIDANCHGKPNLTYVNPDDQSKPVFVLVTMNERENPDGIIFSLHRDGNWNISYWDSKGSGKWDTTGYHPDGKIVPTSYGPYTSN